MKMAYHRTPTDNRKRELRTGGTKKGACLGDLLNAQYVQFPHNSRLYIVSHPQFEAQYHLHEDEDGRITMVGFIKHLPKGKFQISRKMFGIDWISVHRFNEITCIGTKLPYHR